VPCKKTATVKRHKLTKRQSGKTKKRSHACTAKIVKSEIPMR
jgi:hypothetical protein